MRRQQNSSSKRESESASVWSTDAILSYLDGQAIPYITQNDYFRYRPQGAIVTEAVSRSIEGQRRELAETLRPVSRYICEKCKGVIRVNRCVLYTPNEGRRLYHDRCLRALGLEVVALGEFSCDGDEGPETFYSVPSTLCVYCQKREASFPDFAPIPLVCASCWDRRSEINARELTQ